MNKIFVILIPSLILTGITNAAEIYNKDSNKLDLYGKVVGEHNFTTGNVGGPDNSHDSSYAQLGFKGETKINELLTGYGQWEYRTYANEPEGSQVTKTRLAFAGLKLENLGSFDYGRNYGIAYDVGSYTDLAPSFSGKTMYGNNNDNFMTKRASGLLTYRDNNLFDLIEGLSIGIQYQGKNEFSKAYQSNGDGIGYSLGYKLGNGIDVISSYTISNRTHAQQSDNKGKEAETWGVGAKYDVNNLYLAAIYSEGRNSLLDAKKDFVNKSQNFEITAQYQLDFGLRPAISYVMTKGDDLSEATTNGVTFNNGSAFLAKFIEVGASYYFNKSFKVYADYYINMIDKNSNYARVVGGINGNDDMATLGVTYQF